MCLWVGVYAQKKKRKRGERFIKANKESVLEINWSKLTWRLMSC